MNDITKKPVGRPKQENTASELLQLRVSPEQKKAYEKTSKEAGKSLSAWAKDLMDKASK